MSSDKQELKKLIDQFRKPKIVEHKVDDQITALTTVDKDGIPNPESLVEGLTNEIHVLKSLWEKEVMLKNLEIEHLKSEIHESEN